MYHVVTNLVINAYALAFILNHGRKRVQRKARNGTAIQHATNALFNSLVVVVIIVALELFYEWLSRVCWVSNLLIIGIWMFYMLKIADIRDSRLKLL